VCSGDWYGYGDFEVEGCGIFSWSSDVNRLRQRCTVESQGGEKYA